MVFVLDVGDVRIDLGDLVGISVLVLTVRVDEDVSGIIGVVSVTDGTSEILSAKQQMNCAKKKQQCSFFFLNAPPLC